MNDPTAGPGVEGTRPPKLLLGDCRKVLQELPHRSIDACIVDPPYEIDFMGAAWDRSGAAFDLLTWRGVFRALKPGAFLLAFGGTRTYHRLTCAIEDAGFEVRDCIMWIYGSGMPKGKTVLKPAYEPILVARKPCQGPEAACIRKHGTGGMQIDECRVPSGGESLGGGQNTGRRGTAGDGWNRPWMKDDSAVDASASRSIESTAKAEMLGRWPANIIHDGSDEATAGFPETAAGKSGGVTTKALGRVNDDGWQAKVLPRTGHDDQGGSAARYFYCAKATAADRGEGNDHPTVKPEALMRYLCRLVTPPSGTILDNFMGSGSTGKAAVLERFGFVGITNLPEHLAIAKRRIDAASEVAVA